MINKSHRNILGIFILLLLAGFFATPIMPDFTIFGKNIGKYARDLKINLGLDLQGGAHLVYEADMSQIPAENQEESINGIRDIIERRVNAYGIAEPQILTSKSQEKYRIIVDLAGVKDVSEAIKMIGETPVLDFREEKTEEDYRLTEAEKQKNKEINQVTEAKARGVLELAKKGEDFAKLAQQYSLDPTAKETGGDLDFLKKENLIPELGEVVFNPSFFLDSVWPELMKTPYGFHILKKTAERGEGEAKEVRISHILFPLIDEEKRPETEMPFKLTELTGKNLKGAQVVFDQNTQEPQVSLEFDDEGRIMFHEITKRNLGKKVAIFLDGEPITIPTVQAEIAEGRAVITGSQDLTEAKELAKRLNAGALPVPINLISQEKVGATLGKASLKESLVAGGFGVIMVSGFMFIFYLFFGLTAIFSLIFYAVLMTAIFKILGITLTLSGIAGFILSLGMAVDANVLVFERVKEELRSGRKIKLAVENGFKRAWTSIRDGNVSTLITCVILAGLGTGMVKGFAITLGIGVALSMFTAVFITRNILEFLVKIFGERFAFGLEKKKRNNQVS